MAVIFGFWFFVFWFSYGVGGFWEGGGSGWKVVLSCFFRSSSSIRNYKIVGR